MNILEEIAVKTRERIAQEKRQVPQEVLLEKIRSVGSSASSSLSVSRSSCSCASVRASASRNSPTLVRTRLCMVPPQHSFSG